MIEKSLKTLPVILQLIGVFGGIGGMAGLIGAWYVIPYRLGELDRRIGLVESIRSEDRDLLLRIDERLKSVQREIQKP